MQLILIGLKYLVLALIGAWLLSSFGDKRRKARSLISPVGINVFRLHSLVWFLLFSMTLGYHSRIWLYEKSDRFLTVRDQEDYRQWVWEKYVKKGRILDRNGKILAETDQSQKLFRRYPYPEETAHIIGYSSIERRERCGFERRFNPELSGEFSRWYKVWHPIKTIKNILNVHREGRDIRLTLDIELQRTAFRGLAGRKGAAVGIDPKTGEILFLVSSPGYNPYEMYEVTVWSKIQSNEALINRAVEGLYEPGSTFKVIVAAAALEKGLSHFVVNCSREGFIPRGSRRPVTDHEDDFHGRIYLDRAFVKSCNVFFSQLGLALGKETIKTYAEKFFFNRDIPFRESRPLFRDKRSFFPPPAEMDETALAWASIGQFNLQITPLHMAIIASIVANNGIFVEPRIEKSLSKGSSRRIIAWDTSRELRKMMQGAVGDPEKDLAGPRNANDRSRFGTGWRALVRGVNVGGKTGTAENPHGPPHGWFMGVAPVENPVIAFAIIVENGGYGGNVSAPIAKSIIERALQLGYFQKK